MEPPGSPEAELVSTTFTESPQSAPSVSSSCQQLAMAIRESDLGVRRGAMTRSRARANLVPDVSSGLKQHTMSVKKNSNKDNADEKDDEARRLEKTLNQVFGNPLVRNEMGRGRGLWTYDIL